MIAENIIIFFSKKIFIIILLLTTYSETFSQHNNNSKNILESSSILEVKFEQLPSELGISNSVISCIVQDQDGFMWFPLTPGLIKYDGNNFRTYGKVGSLEDSSDYVTGNGIQGALKDKHGDLWFGTNGGLLLKYNKDCDKFSGIDLSEKLNISHTGAVKIISEDLSGDLLIGTNSAGLIIYNKKTQAVQYYNNTNSFLSSNIVNTLYVDRKGFIYIGTEDKGLFIFDRTKNEFKNYEITNDSFGLSSNAVRCIYEDTGNNIWIGTNNGLNLFNRQSRKFIKFFHENENKNSISNDNIRDICEDKNNHLWIATYGGGLNKYENDGIFNNYRYDRNNSLSLCSDFLSHLYTDDSNVLWIGTFNRGVCKFDLEKKNFFTVSRFFINSEYSKTNDVSSIYMDSTGLLWISTRLNKGIFKFKKTNNGYLEFKEYSVIPDIINNETITSCFENKSHNLWFCGQHGKLYEYEAQNKIFRTYENKTGVMFWKMFPLDEEHIFISTTSGYLKFDMKRKEFSDLNVHSDSFQIFTKEYDQQWGYVDKERNLWFDWGGLVKYEVDKDKFTKYAIDTAYGIWPTVCGEDKKGRLLIVTSHGLDILDKSNSIFTFYPVRIGGYIIEDDYGYLWAGSDFEYGLNKFNPENNDYRLYDITDGLQGNRFNSQGIPFKDKDGTLYFGGPNGLTYFNPKEIKDNTYIPNIVLTNFQILNESVKPSPENPFLKKNITAANDITLSYRENVFSFEFAALIYNNPSKNQYAYMMEGFDKDWVYSGKRRNVTYTNLDPGDYTFRVKGSNNDGIWNEEGTSIKITITPPWWQTWWFKSCGAVLIFMTAGYGYKKRVNKLKKEKSAQEEFSKKLLNSQEEERKKIASVLHDSIAHDVLITKNSSEIGLRSDADKEEMKEIFNKISEQSSSTLNELRRIQFNLHPYEVEKLGLTKAIKSIVDRVSKSTEIKFTFEENFIDKIFSEENEIHLYRIIQEAVNNIIKHSSATEAGLKINRTDENIFITISDNGKGFSKNYALRKNSMGLSGMSERVKLLGGSLETDSESGNGTVLRISLPVEFKK